VDVSQHCERPSEISRMSGFLRDESGLGLSEYWLLLAFLFLASGALFVTERHVPVAVWLSVHPVLKGALRLLRR